MYQQQRSMTVAPRQLMDQNTRRAPIDHAKTIRTDNVNVVTSSFGGLFVPLKMVPLLREDGVLNSQLNVNVQMAETASMLLNPVRVNVGAALVPKLAFDRFADMGTINRSYNGQTEIDGSVTPWFDPYANKAADIFTTLGLHFGTDDLINSDYIEAYNQLWNFLAEQHSPSIEKRAVTDGTLAPAFWEHNQMKHVKPNFDDAMLQGTVPLSLVAGRMPVKTDALPGQTVPEFIGITDGAGDYNLLEAAGGGQIRVKAELGLIAHQMYAEMEESGIEVSLANLDLARETAAWARLRTQFQGISEDWMIDQLLSGVRIRDENLRHPILLDQKQAVMGMTERYATDSGNLEKSVTNGQTSVSLSLRAPEIECGGVIVIYGQVLPEQIYERQRDYYIQAATVEDLPNRTSDELDPQPVEMVRNGEVDSSHSLPDDLFGYAPLNARWQRNAPNVGGRYYRARPDDAWTESRNRIWAADVVDPSLGEDFYLSNELSHEVFADSTTDPFEWWINGNVRITGLTYFGPGIRESEGDYDAVLEQVDLERLKGDGSDVPPATTQVAKTPAAK